MSAWLVVGLLLFLGVHSLGMLAPGWREGMVARLGANGWKGVYSLLSLVGLVLIVIGYREARADALLLYAPPLWTRHLAALLMLPAFVLLVASKYVTGTWLKARVGHPMVLGTKVWALAHLLANGMLADVVLFGSFGLWAVLLYVHSRREDRRQGRGYPARGWQRDALAWVIGAVVWAVFAFWLHGWLFGVRPLG